MERARREECYREVPLKKSAERKRRRMKNYETMPEERSNKINKNKNQGYEGLY